MQTRLLLFVEKQAVEKQHRCPSFYMKLAMQGMYVKTFVLLGKLLNLSYLVNPKRYCETDMWNILRYTAEIPETAPSLSLLGAQSGDLPGFFFCRNKKAVVHQMHTLPACTVV